jgi:hypothetical protein
VGKAARPTKGIKIGKPSQNGKEELRKAQNQHPLESTPPNPLNASSLS